MHISDCDGKVHGDLPPGRGVVEFVPYLQAIGRVGVASNTISLELEYSPEPAELTVEAWVNLPEFPAGPDTRRWIVNKNANEWAEGHYALVLDGGKVGAYLNIGGGEKNCVAAWSAAGRLKLNQWQHLALTYDGKELKVFLDGQVAATTAVNKARVPGKSTLAIGRRQDGYNYFKGTIDEARVYGRALPEAELAAHFAKPEETAAAKDAKLAVHCGFDEKGAATEWVPKFVALAGLEEPYRTALLGKR